MKITAKSLMLDIGTLASAEKITKAKLASLSRDILVFLLYSEDVRPINALMGTGEDGSFILTPINWRIAAQYFNHFLPYKSNYSEEVKEYAEKAIGSRVPLVFGSKNKRTFDKHQASIKDFLENGSNDIWTWSTNVQMEQKPVDYAGRITTAVKSGVSKGDMSSVDVLCAVLEAEGMDIGQLIAAMEVLGQQAEAA